MPQFSANLGVLWPELSLTDRIHAAQRSGFPAVECHFPFETPAEEVREALQACGLPLLSLNSSPGDIAGGEFGLAAVPGRDIDCRAAIDQAIEYAVATDAHNVHVMAGLAGDSDSAIDTYIGNLAYAGTEAGKRNLGILIEPINRIDHPGYTLNRIEQAVDILEVLRSRDSSLDNVRLIFDCYHVQMTEGNVAARLEAALPWIGHIQIAAVPGRAEPDQGELDYAWLFDHIDRLDYDGYVGAEYIPGTTTENGLGWFMPWRQSRSGNGSVGGQDSVYNGLNQERLDAEYNNSGKIEDAQQIIDWYTARSIQTRGEIGGELDLVYGDTTDQTLDLFFPNGESGGPAARPVHVFFHGGYWRAMHKNDFSYVANFLTGSNGICAVANYGLVPTIDFEMLVEQCRRSLIWLFRNIADYGGNPNRITISGHSAGGHLVGMMMATDWPRQDRLCPADLIKGGVAISPLMDLEPIRLSFLNETLGLTPAVVRRNSPVHLSNRGRGKLTCYYGQLEGSEYRRQSESLAHKWSRTDAVGLAGHNHFTIAQQLDKPDSEIARTIRRQMGM